MTARARVSAAARAMSCTPAVAVTSRRACWLASVMAATPVASQTQPQTQPQTQSQTQTQTAAASASDSVEPAAKVSPLLSQLLERVAPANRDAADGEAGLFRRLAKQHKAAMPPPTDGRRGATAGAAALMPALVPALAPALVPALGYAMEQLDPVSFAVLRPIPVAGSGPLLRTGDVFVLQFSTSLPGQVRLENIDAKGRVADLGTHTVFVDQLNRVPRDKGIQLQGQPGLERLRFYFYPCLPPEAAGKPWTAEFQGKLPPCATAPVLQSAQAGRHSTPYGVPSSTPYGIASSTPYGVVAPRALVNLAQPDAHLVFAASPEYQPGDLTLMEALIRHEGRGHGR